MVALLDGIPQANMKVPADVRVGFSIAEPAEWLGGDDAFWQSLAGVTTGETQTEPAMPANTAGDRALPGADGLTALG